MTLVMRRTVLVIVDVDVYVYVVVDIVSPR